ncbi:protein ATP6V1FNB-like [Frieseomelitta varia]|uniref:protein ATP6V1FNB-like n=1 Tax=Frieseomelitta varia TaxID=561572 RepID=UPI001CB69B52|nr:protein ATP6V1FNB-like [Frieseomelitta varia]
MSIRGGICDARCQAFYTAMIQKEENTRIRWFLKNQQKLLDHLEKTKEIKLPPKHIPKKQPIMDIIRLKPLPNWRPLECDGSINMNIMKPIDPQVRAILYEDAPSFINAENYIYERVKDIPENRYYYPDCANWIYGWRLTDYSSIPRNEVGKTNVMIREFYRPRISSLQRDPEWYRPSRRITFVYDDEIN